MHDGMQSGRGVRNKVPNTLSVPLANPCPVRGSMDLPDMGHR
jgi:hypothetical protein